MLILDKHLAIERMVAVASRPRVPAAFRRSVPAIEGIMAPAAAGAAPQRRLAGVLVLAGGRGEEHEPPAVIARQPLAVVDETPSAPPAPHVPPILLPELHTATTSSIARSGAIGCWRRLVRLLRVAPPPPTPGAIARPPRARIDTGSIHAWHARPVDVSS